MRVKTDKVVFSFNVTGMVMHLEELCKGKQNWEELSQHHRPFLLDVECLGQQRPTKRTNCLN